MKKRWKRIDKVLLMIVALALILNVFNIWKEDYANPYYMAAVKSMLESWKNFFFASFDPAGYVTVDKPPVALWVQTISAYLFGYHGWSVILPQALAGIGSVVLLYALVKPTFGRTAARLASLVMACTPIAAAVSRTNNIDSLLVFTLLVATWMLFRGVKQDKIIWLLGAFALIGVGFNMKMLQAYMILPAFFLWYVFKAKGTWKKKAGALSGAVAVLLVVSVSWALIVDSIPKDKRPYIGSSQTNSVLELAFGYNGVSRLTGQGGMPNMTPEMQEKLQEEMKKNGGSMPGPFGKMTPDMKEKLEEEMKKNGGAMPGPFGNMTPDMKEKLEEEMKKNGGAMPGPSGNVTPDMGGIPMMQGGMFGTGEPGPLRLFQSALSSQISWLLPFVLLGCIALLWDIRKRTNAQKESIFWLAWLLPAAGFFSIAGFFHHYYLIMLAPPIAALTAAGWTALVKGWREGRQAWLLPLAVFTTSAFQLYVMLPHVGIGWIVALGVLGIGMTILLLLRRNEKLALVGFFVLLLAPLYWSATPMLYGNNNILPEAGPKLKASGNMMNGMLGEKMDEKTLRYLQDHHSGETYLFATTNANTAAPYIIETGEAVMAMGGYLGSDPIMTVERLQNMITAGDVKYFLLPTFGMGGNTDVEDWIRTNGREVPKEEWKSETNDNPMDAGLQLYEITK
ncbi:glycosyltransferase family 39 protein [Ectobacillus sp. JY-23]|uniref:glycosyltransferase family 39 protein n=1 Tax=Ectobacillus sp. JY-23 TaxID=2933872 RepID=UPI001FF4AE97|nr:glycosyltransferase family 39 protein [Ectobacillus sp. JY-23]UOY92476.1 glycosyltransferase family 39 protein [Ectobacillus sp. JY-23]